MTLLQSHTHRSAHGLFVLASIAGDVRAAMPVAPARAC